jgi:hypothetical protein
MKYLKPTVSLVLLFSLLGCEECQKNRRLKPVNRYQYFEAEVDDIPPLQKIEAILLTPHYHPELFYNEKAIYVIGNPKTVEKIVGHEIFPRKVINDPTWILRITSDFKSAHRTKMGSISDARAVFITKERAYMVLIDKNDEVVYGTNYKSSQLRHDFEELGLFDHEESPSTNNVMNYPKLNK